jgi:hypothetical protein
MFNLIDKVKAASVLDNLDNVHAPVGDKDRTQLDLNSVTNTITSIIRVALDVIAYLAAAYFLYGAFMYIISYGNEAKAGKAKQTMIWAVAGLAIAILARLLVNVTITQFSNSPNDANLTNQINTQGTPVTPAK